MIRYTNGHIEDWYNGLNPEYLHFEWINANQKDYVVYQNNIKISKLYKKLDIKIENPFNFPFNTKYGSWGSSVTIKANETIIKNIYFNNNIESIIIKEVDFKNNNVIFNYFDDDINSFIDTKLNRDNYLRSFSDGTQYYFNNITSNAMFYFEKMRSNDVMYPSKKTEKHINIATLDIETYLDNNEHKILCVCFYDGTTTHKFYINDFINTSDLLHHLFETLFQPKYNDYNIYIHNGSSFDLIFLLKQLSNFKNINIIPTYKDGKFLYINTLILKK